MVFLKRTAIWATVWWTIICAIATFNDVRSGTFDLATTAPLVLGLWVFFFILVAAVKGVVALRVFGFRLGQQALENPKQDAMDGIRKAARPQSGPRR